MTQARGDKAHYNADGTSKTGYRTRREARRVSRLIMLKVPGLRLRVYGCGSCDEFHMGKAGSSERGGPEWRRL